MKRYGAMLLGCAIAVAMLMQGLQAFAVGYGQGKCCDAQNRPVDAVSFQSEHADVGAYALTPDEHRIVLTFDQGYENGFTDEILDVLKEKQVSAIFFLTGDYAQRESELVKRMLAEGHCLGNHGMKHAAAPTLSEEALQHELMDLHQYVQEHYDYTMQYFRPPCGEYDEQVLQTVQALGYQTVFWSVAYVDWNPDAQPEPTAALQTLTDAAHGGAIYLLHSVSETNAAILGELIDALRDKGYTL